MRIGVRLGVFRDREVIAGVLPPDAPIVVPAHIGAYALDGLRGFLADIAKDRGTDWVDYIFDPMTYWVDLPSRYWSRGSERGRGQDLVLPLTPGVDEKKVIRPTLVALLREYGLGRAVFETDLQGMRRRLLDAVGACLEFQRRGTMTTRGRARGKYARILELAAEQEAIQPMAIVAPYLKLHGLGDVDAADQMVLNARSLEARLPGEAMWTIIAIEAGAQLGAIDQAVGHGLRLAEFDAVGVWASDLDEYTESSQRLRHYRQLLRSINRPIWILYGTYFSMLLAADGVELVSHGIYYTESKRMEGPIGSGPPPERYYLPSLHRFYEPTAAFRLIELVPDFECPCPECPSLDVLRAEASAAGSSPARRVAWAQRLQRHFLLARQRELDAVKTSTLPELVAQLEVARAAVEGLDPTDLGAITVSVAHLATWRAALAEN